MMMMKKLWKNQKVRLGVLSAALLVAVCFLVGCGTMRGAIDGVESIGRGLLQDMRGAVNGVSAADREGE